LPPELAALPTEDPGQPELAHDPRLRLGVNIDHVATIVTAAADTPRPRPRPRSPWARAPTAHRAPARGSPGHISDADIESLAKLTRRRGRPLNFEMAVTDEMQAIALRHRPHAVCSGP